MLAVDIGFDPALNLGNPGAGPGAHGASLKAAGGPVADTASRAAASGSQGSFHSILRHTEQSVAPEGLNAVPCSGEAAPDTDRTTADAVDDQPSERMCRMSQFSIGGEPVLNDLVQLIQSMIQSSAKLAEAADTQPLEEQPEADVGEDGEGFLRFINLLKQLQTAQGERRAESVETLAQILDVLTQGPAGPEGAKANSLPGRIHQWLAQAQETFPGIPWGRLAQLITGLSAGAPSPPPYSDETGLVQKGDVPLDDAGRTALAGLLREVFGKSKPEAAETRGIAAGPEASTSPAPEPAATKANDLPRPVVASTTAPEGHRRPDGLSTDSGREPSAAPGRDAAMVQEIKPPAENLRPLAPEASAPLAIAAEDGGDDGASAAVLRDVRTAPAPEIAADKPAEATAMAKHREAAGAAVKGDVVEQIVQRSVVHLKSAQGEARIDLKPEFLGQVRMQIVTDSQQVTVRIVTELPMVRDLIEQNLDQLKSDLRQQGLQVERVEVSVADDPRRDAGRHGRAGRGRNGHGSNEVDAPAVGSVEQRAQALSAYWSSGDRTTINMFA